MATVQKRTWLGRGPSGRRVRKVSWGYTLQANGKQERKFSAAWTEAEARTELAKRILAKGTATIRPTTLAQAAERYLQAKARKRSLRRIVACSSISWRASAPRPACPLSRAR